MKTNSLTLLITLVLIISGINSNIMAQSKKRYAALETVKTSETLNVSADSLWKIIKHPNIALWSTLLDSTEYFGEEVFEGVSWSKRISSVNSKGHHESHEDLIAYDDANMEIKFASTKFPGFIISNETHWKVINKGENRSVLQVSTHMRMKKFFAFFLKRPMLKAINKNGDGILYDIKFYAEKGIVSPSKQARLEMLQNN